MNEASFSDYLPLLNAKGYMAYSFDVSAIKGKNVMFNIREFVNGKEVEDSSHDFLFPYTFTANGDKLVVGFLPSEKDSLALCCFSWENTLSFTDGTMQTTMPLTPCHKAHSRSRGGT